MADKADTNPATPNSPYATVNQVWAGNAPVNPFGNIGDQPSEAQGLAHFSDNQSLPSADLGGSVVSVRPPA